MSNTSILNCFNHDGAFNIEEYLKLRSRRKQSVEETLDMCFAAAASKSSTPTKRKHTRDIRGQMPMKKDVAGNVVPIDPTETIWWSLY